MQATKKRGSVRRGSILWLSPDEIDEGLTPVREQLDERELRGLADSIAQYGILHPLTVRLRDDRYELIAGQRRLCAAKLLGLREVPCTLLDVTMEEASLLALTENLQRRDPDLKESALGLGRLSELFGMNREEAARRLGLPPDAVADRLRLLQLPEDALDTLLAAGLGEKHANALLRLPDADARRRAASHIAENDLNLSAATAYIDALLKGPEPKRVFVLKDVRVFLNTVSRGLELMRQSGIDATLSREDTDDKLVLHISIPKKGE